MKKILLTLAVMCFALSANAAATDLLNLNVGYSDIEVVNLSYETMWQKLGIKEQKVYNVGSKILNANKINKRVVFHLNSFSSPNASAYYQSKSVSVNKGMLNYLDNDDELAAVLAHEIAHSIEYYGGLGKVIIMSLNAKSYEYQADLDGVDYMVKAGYNPIAMITAFNKIMGENTWDWGVLWSHPKTSSRLMNIYKHIYRKYPKYLTSDMTKNVNYQNWVYTAQKDISKFQQKERKKLEKRGDL